MKYFFKITALFISCFCITFIFGQNAPIPLTCKDFDSLGQNQISGICSFKDNIYLLGEHKRPYSELCESWKIFRISTNSIEINEGSNIGMIKDTKTIYLDSINYIMNKIDVRNGGVSYDGLESILIINDTVYFTVETKYKRSDSGYLIRGFLLNDNNIRMDTSFLIGIPKPGVDKRVVYNAGFESMIEINGYIYVFFEFNNYQSDKRSRVYGSNIVYKILPDSGIVNTFPIDPIPFRLTDVTKFDDCTFLATNFFFKGNEERIYRENISSQERDSIYVSNSYRSFGRVIKISLKNNKFSLENIWNIPRNAEPNKNFTSWNWEGIQRFRNGVLIINDQYKGSSDDNTSLIYFDLGL